MTQVIVLNGGSSSGKSSIARALQQILPDAWLAFGVDDLVDALPGHGEDPRSGIVIEPDGTVTVAPAFCSLEDSWYRALASMAHDGARIILDEVFLTGGREQARLRDAFDGLEVTWVGVRCDPAVAAAREAGRPDRVLGMAVAQADLVHTGVTYDIEVDTTEVPVAACAQGIAAQVVR